jgi:hypothetical protein
MKRSEIIKVMVEAYSDRIKDQTIYFCPEDAERVLKAIEEFMIPNQFYYPDIEEPSNFRNLSIEMDLDITNRWEDE